MSFSMSTAKSVTDPFRAALDFRERSRSKLASFGFGGCEREEGG